MLCVLHRNHTAPLNVRDAAGKEGLKNMKPAISIAIYAVPEGQPSILEGNLCGIPASILEPVETQVQYCLSLQHNFQ